MTALLGQAIDRIGELPEDEQDSIASIILEEIESERRWKQLFDASPDVLARMAQDARAEHRAGETQLLDPDLL